MPSKKISELQTLTTPAGVDRLIVVDDPLGTPVNKQISFDRLLANLPSNTTITKTLTVSGNTTFNGANTYITANVNITGRTRVGTFTTTSNGLIITNKLTPANSSVSSITNGKIFFDDNYLYVKVGNTTIKRISLQSF